ncbi:hypothetical protein [Actinomadura litoris]|nr:hypothetical protein [Actinomadura litoris]
MTTTFTGTAPAAVQTERRSRKTGARTMPGVPRWAYWAAHAAALTTLPSALWRLPMTWGYGMGFTDEAMTDLHVPGWGSVYVLVLILLSELASFATLGLIQPWGERFPRWMPFVGGRRVSVRFAVTTAMLGAMTVLLYTVGYFYTWTHRSAGSPTGAWAWLMNASFAPVVAWGPLLIAVTVHYHRRRRAARPA